MSLVRVDINRGTIYKQMTLVTVGVARLRTLTAQRPRVPSIDQNLKLFTVNRDISI